MDRPVRDEHVADFDRITINTNLLLVFGVTLMAVMGVASIAPAFPRIMDKFGLSKMEVGMLISSFTIPGVVLAPVMGVLADRWGRKKVLVPALILFGIAGGACAFARDFHVLLLFRFFQGVGASTMGTLSPTIIGDLYSGKQRTVVMGYNASVLSMGTASYPALGGALAMFGWQYPFLLPLTAIPLALIVLYLLRNPEPRNSQPIGDYMKNTLKSLGKRQVIGIFMIGIVTFFIIYGCYLTFFPIILGSEYHASPFTIGMVMFCTSITTALVSWQIKRLVRRWDEKTLIKVGFSLYALSMLTVPFITSIWGFAVPVLIYGMGVGINIPCITSLLTSLAPIEQRAAFLSINSMMLRVGQTLGPLFMGAVAGLFGVTGVFYAGAALALFMVAIATVMVR